MGLFSFSKKEKTVAIFDIGSGSVGGAIVDMPLSDDGVPIIKKVVRTEIKSHKIFDFNVFIKDMVSALDTTAMSLYNKKAGAPEEIVCVFSSPWYLSVIREIKMNRGKTTVFTNRLADDLIQKEISGLNQQYKDKYDKLESIPEMIEHHTTSVSLNGYPTEDPMGKKFKSLLMSMIISLSPKIYLDNIRETLSKTFHYTKVTFSSFTLATYLAVRDKYITPDSYLLIDISGEITDVGVVTKGVLKSVLSFPFGRKTFLNSISEKLNIELRDTEEIFKLYNSKNLFGSSSKKIEPILKLAENSWRKLFNESISSLPHTFILPSTVFLTADKDIINWFADIFRNDKSFQPTVIKNKCDVITLDAPMFSDICKVNSEISDPFLMIESIAIMRKMKK